MADLQTTLSLVLSAKDEASAVLRQVGDRMAQLANETVALQEKTARAGLSVGSPEAMRAVADAQTAAVKTGVAQRLAALQEEGRSATAEYRAEAEANQRRSRETRDSAIADARRVRDETIATARADTTLQASERKQRVEDARNTANATIEQVRREYTERERLGRESLARNVSEVHAYTAAQSVAARAGGAQSTSLIGAGVETATATTAQAGIVEAAQRGAEESRFLGEALSQIKEPEGLKLTAADLHAVSQAARTAAPSVKEFEAALRQAALGAGPRRVDQVVAVDEAVRGATAAIKAGAREQTDAVRAAAQEQKQAISAGLAAQKDAISEYVRSQTAQIEAFSRQMQQLLRAAYSAPGVSESLKAEGQKTVEDLRMQSEAMAQQYRSRGQEMTREAEKTAQEARTATERGQRDELRLIEDTQRREVAAVQRAGMQHVGIMSESMNRSQTAVHGLGLAFDEFHAKLGEPIKRMEQMTNGVRQMFYWNMLYPMTGQLVQVFDSLTTGLITTNVQLEQFSMTLSAIYQLSGPQGIATATAMTHWLDAFAAKVPGTRQQVREAALAFAAAGDNVAEILPAASNLAAIMGVELPKAAQAMIDAQMGRFEMLQVTMHTTKAELEGYGLEVDRTGHVLNNSFVPAIERYVAVRFGEHIAFGTRQVADFHRTLLAAGGQLGTNAQLILNAASIRAGGLDTTDLTGQNRPQRVAHDTAQAVAELASRNIQTQQQGLAALHQMYGITLQDLERQGTGWNRTGASAEAAVAKILAAQYGGANVLMAAHAQQSAIELQMRTLGGAWSNVIDAFTNIQQIIGQGMFDRLHGQVHGLYMLLGSPALQLFATQLGTMLGEALQRVIDGFHHWTVEMGGLPGILSMVTQTATAAWAAIQGIGDALGLVWGVLRTIGGAIIGVMGMFGFADRSAQSVRTLTAAVVDLFLAWKVWTTVQAGWNVLVAFNASGANLVKEGREAIAKENAAAAARTAAAAEEQQIIALQTQTGVLTEATLATDALTAANERLALSQGGAGVGGALGAGETAVAGAGAVGAGEAAAVGAGAAAAESVGIIEAAGAGIVTMGAAAWGAIWPLGLFVTAIAGVAVAATKAVDDIKKANDAARAAKFGPPHKIPLTDTEIGIAGAGGSGGIMDPSFLTDATSADTTSLAVRYRKQVPTDALKAYDQWLAGTDQAWVAYLDTHHEALTKMNAFLKQHGQQTISAASVHQEVLLTTQAARGFSKDDVDRLTAQAEVAHGKLLAAAKVKSPDVVGLLDQYRQLTSAVSEAKGENYDTMQARARAVGAKFWNDFHTHLPKQIDDALQGALAGIIAPGKAGQTGYTPQVYQDQLKQVQQLLGDALEGGDSWANVAKAFDRVRQVTWRGAREAGATTDDVAIQMKSAIGAIGQNLSSKLKWDNTLDRGFAVAQQEIGGVIQGFQKLHVPMDQVAHTLVPIILQQAQQDIPSLVKAGPEAIKAYTRTLEQELQPLIPDARTRARVIASAVDGILTAVAQQLQEVFQAYLTLNNTQGALAQIPALMAQKQKDLANMPAPQRDVVLAAYHQQLNEQAQQPAVRAAQTTLQYDEMIRAPWSKIVSDINAYAGALSHTSQSAQEQAIAMHSAWQTALGTHQQNLELQLQYDQMMHAPYATIVADIGGISAAMSAAGEDFRTVAVKTHDLLVAASQREAQTQEGLLGYGEAMGQPLSQLMGYVTHATAANATNPDMQPWQRTLENGKLVEGATDSALATAIATGASFDRMNAIVNVGAIQLRQAGFSRIAVENWMTDEMQKIAEALKRQSTALQTQYGMDVEHGRVTTVADALREYNAQVGLINRERPEKGETPEQFRIRQKSETENALRTAMQPIGERLDKQFQYDSQVATPSFQVLQRDTNARIAFLADEYRRGVISQQDYLLGAQAAQTALNNIFGNATPGQVPAPQYGRSSPFSTPTQYGGATAFYGPIGVTSDPNAALVRHLRDVIHTLERQLANEEKQVQKLEDIHHDTQRVADNTAPGHTMGHEPVYATPPSPGGRMRSTGGGPVHHRS